MVFNWLLCGHAGKKIDLRDQGKQKSGKERRGVESRGVERSGVIEVGLTYFA